MIDLYYAPTPNGLKLKIFVEESGIEHRIVPVRLAKGEQFTPEFLAISPNNKIPALVDHEPADGCAPLALFESCAMLAYLGEKTGMFYPQDPRAQLVVKQWLMWQAAGLGPMAGQAGHFRAHAAEKVEYAINRYTNELARLYGVLDRRLQGRDFICGEYSVADMAAYPWVFPYHGLGQSLSRLPDLARWFDNISQRPAVICAYQGIEDTYCAGASSMGEEERRILFGPAAKTS